MTDPEEIVQALLRAFPDNDAMRRPDTVEQVMRPFAPLSTEIEQKVSRLLWKEKKSRIALSLGSWMEANIVAGPPSDEREERIQFLLHDTCSCVLVHLEDAIKHAPGPVDERILALAQRSKTVT